jgi:hypothetical protein
MVKVVDWGSQEVSWGRPFSFVIQVKDSRVANGNKCPATAELAALLKNQLSLEVEDGDAADVVVAKLESISVQDGMLKCTGALELAGGVLGRHADFAWCSVCSDTHSQCSQSLVMM